MLQLTTDCLANAENFQESHHFYLASGRHEALGT